MTKNKRTIYKAELPPHRFLREMLRHYIEMREYVTQGHDHVIEHSYLVKDEKGLRKITMSFSFWDLHRGIADLPPHKKEALFYTVILDKKQKEVAEIMGCSTVSAGQYCDSALKSIVDDFYEGGKAIMTVTNLEEND